jgi:hypothetical protein
VPERITFTYLIQFILNINLGNDAGLNQIITGSTYNWSGSSVYVEDIAREKHLVPLYSKTS